VPERPSREAVRFGFALLLAIISVMGFARPAAAHNSFVSSDPADGARLSAAPSALNLTFSGAVVLAQLQVDYTDALGVRSVLSGFDFAPSGQATVTVPIPAAASGDVSFRWKLVGPDGHIVSGRVGLSISIAASATTGPPTAPLLETTLAPTTDLEGEPAADGVTAQPKTNSTIDASSSLSVVKWLLRLVGFVGLVTIVGAVLTSALLWNGAWHEEIVRQATGWSIALVTGSALLSLAIFANEATGLGIALGTPHGVALFVRFVIAVMVGLALYRWYPDDDRQRWAVIGIGLVALAATWSWSGHPKSLHWPILGVPLDVAHLVAAAAWVGGLGYMGIIVMRTATDEEQTAAVHAFSPIASKSVVILVITGALQSLRIDGSPLNLFITTHGRLLLLKLLVLGLMLYVANVNRTRVTTRLQGQQPIRGSRAMLQRAMVTEAAVGLVILAITAVLIVNSPPG
jgi:copper transport protein